MRNWKMGNKVTIKATITTSKDEEIHAGYIRISENLRCGIRNGDYIKLTTNSRTIYCQVRGTPNNTNLVKISEWYREL